jgi:uncharacterized protein YutE (UPF0331/DUF86 family)
MRKSQTYEIIAFLKEEISYFKVKSKGISFDRFTSDKDLRKILNATLNEIVLAIVDLAGECLRKAGRRVPNTYREIILTTRELLGDIALKAAPLAKLRNETIHEYMNINWKNIQYLRSRGLNTVERYLKKAEEFLR